MTIHLDPKDVDALVAAVEKLNAELEDRKERRLANDVIEAEEIKSAIEQLKSAIRNADSTLKENDHGRA